MESFTILWTLGFNNSLFERELLYQMMTVGGRGGQVREKHVRKRGNRALAEKEKIICVESAEWKGVPSASRDTAIVVR